MLPKSRTSIKRTWNRGQLLHLLKTKRLITRINIDDESRFYIDHSDWDEYWLTVKQSKRYDVLLERLKVAWASYVEGGFDVGQIKDYCFSYFQLLNVVTANCLKNPKNTVDSETLLRILAFETFGVSLTAQGNQVIAGATSTVRHPAYLLTKLKMPDMRDSAEHLPLILPPEAPQETLYYHYRQHRLSRNNDIAVLSYLAVNQRMRPASFRAIEKLEQGVAGSTDPFAEERAALLARSGINVYLKKWCHLRKDVKQIPVDLIDLGAGSGLVASRLCGVIMKTLTEGGCSPRFRIWFIDLSISEPKRFFSSRNISQYVDSIEVIGANYRQWIGQRTSLPAHDGIRVVLISRFLNNLSDFHIKALNSTEGLQQFASPLRQTLEMSCPIRCLAPEKPTAEQLVVSNARIHFTQGRTFRQFSLSPYFFSLQLALTQGNLDANPQSLNQSAFLPVRTFRPSCLLMPNGNSLLATLARQSNLMVIQDADMRPQDMRLHCSASNLKDLTVIETTRSAGLRGYYSYVMGKRADPILRDIEGDCIW